jgi:hypothetical protein
MAAWQASARVSGWLVGRLVLVSAAAVLFAASPSKAQDKGACPEPIATLLPKDGVHRTGTYNAAGEMGLGSGAADLRFKHPCVATTEFPARITIAVTYYGGESAQLLQMQGEAVDQQTLQNAAQELGKRSGAPVRTEDLAGGRIVYVSTTSACPAVGAGEGPDTRPPVPNVRLTGTIRTDTARMEVTLDGRITLDLAKAAVAEVFANLKKARFEPAP